MAVCSSVMTPEAVKSVPINSALPTLSSFMQMALESRKGTVRVAKNIDR